MSSLGGRERVKARQLYACAKTVGKAFLLDALERGIVSEHEAMLAIMIHPSDCAIRLGYVMAASAYAVRNDSRVKVLATFADWFKELLARQQLARHQRMSQLMNAMMVEEGKKPLPYIPPTPSEREPMRSLVDSRFSSAERCIAELTAAVRANAPRPFQAAYDDLMPSFGGRGDAEELERRYGAVLTRVFTEARRAVADV